LPILCVRAFRNASSRFYFSAVAALFEQPRWSLQESAKMKTRPMDLSGTWFLNELTPDLILKLYDNFVPISSGLPCTDKLASLLFLSLPWPTFFLNAPCIYMHVWPPDIQCLCTLYMHVSNFSTAQHQSIASKQKFLYYLTSSRA